MVLVYKRRGVAQRLCQYHDAILTLVHHLTSIGSSNSDHFAIIRGRYSPQPALHNEVGS